MRYDCIKFKRIRNLTWSEYYNLKTCITAQKMKFSIKDFFSKCDQIRRKLRIWSHSLKKSLMETSYFMQCIYQQWNVSRFGLILFLIYPYLAWIQRKIKIKVYSTFEFVICWQNKFSFSNMIKALISINLSLFTCKT